MLRRELFLFLRINFQNFSTKSKRAPLYFFFSDFFELNFFFFTQQI